MCILFNEVLLKNTTAFACVFFVNMCVLYVKMQLLCIKQLHMLVGGPSGPTSF